MAGLEARIGALERELQATRRRLETLDSTPAHLLANPGPIASWRGGINNRVVGLPSGGVMPWVERLVNGRRFCTVSGGIVTFTRAGKYWVHYSIDVGLGSTNAALDRHPVLSGVVRTRHNGDVVAGFGAWMLHTAAALSGSANSVQATLTKGRPIVVDENDTLSQEVTLGAYDAGASGTGYIMPDADEDFGGGEPIVGHDGMGSTLCIFRLGQRWDPDA